MSEKHSNEFLIWTGVKYLWFDIGLTAALGAFLGALLAAAGTPPIDIQDHPMLTVLGMFVSIYAGYLLRTDYPNTLIPLYAAVLPLTAIAVSNIYFSYLDPELHVLQQIIIGTAAVLAYIFGWYAAGTTDYRAFKPTPFWFNLLVFVGAIFFIFILIGLVAVVSGTA